MLTTNSDNPLQIKHFFLNNEVVISESNEHDLTE